MAGVFDWQDIPQYQPPDIGDWLTNAEEVKYNNYSTAYANQLNAYVSAKTNELNYQMMNEQNLWNLQRRDEEWAYNDPSAQMKRMIAAGINPVMAVGQLQNSPAQQLTSADWAGAQGFQAAQAPALHGADPVQALLRAGDGVMNSVGNFAQTMLGARNADIDARRQGVLESMAPSQIARNEADAMESRQQAKVLGTVAEFNANSMSDRLKMIEENLRSLQEQIKKASKETDYYDSLISKNEAETKLAQNRVSVDNATLQQNLMRISILQQMADIQGQDVANRYKIATQEYQLNKEKFDFQLKHAKVEDVLGILRLYNVELFGKASAEGSLKVAGSGVTVSGEAGAKTNLPNLEKAAACIDHLHNVYIENPTTENLRAYSEGVKLVEPLFQVPYNIPEGPQSPVSSQLMNPFMQ